MARYTVLRLMIFFGLLCALWLLGLRDVSQRWWLLGLSAFGSVVVSYFVLQAPRAQFSASIARRIDQRARGAHQTATERTDEIAEDAEAEQDSQHS
jgi:C4-dicarboxylate-specific signal transduction histidine kinase